MKRWSLLLLIGLLGACAGSPPRETPAYNLELMQRQAMPEAWLLEGRLAAAKGKDAVSLFVTWRHDAARDEISLSGPLSQGMQTIVSEAGKVVVDDGNSRREYAADLDAVAAAELGVAAPLSALRYWVCGVTVPDIAYALLDDGFTQLDWVVRFTDSQAVAERWLPRKMTLQQDSVKLKFVVDRWMLW